MDEEKSLKNAVAGSLIWKFLERGGVQIVQFIVSIVIARIVAPEAYGVVAIVTVFTTLATVFVQSGLSTALIQKKDADSTDYSSIFYYSLFVATIAYAVLFFVSKYIAVFYNMPELTSLLRVMLLVLFPGAFNSVQIAVLSKKMQFKKQFYSGLVAASLSGIIGIVTAVIGFGTWALVFQQLSYQFLICLVLWFLVKWRPTLEFSFSKTKTLLKYGVRLLGARLIDTLYHNLETLIIGKKYSTDALAFYSKGKQFPLIIIDNLDGSVQSVMLSAYSKKQEYIDQVKQMLRRTLSLSTYIVFPAMVGLAIVGEPLILLVLGDAWKECVPFLQLYCFISMLFPLQTANLQAINAIGRSDIYLKLMTIKRVVGVILLFAAVWLFDNVLSIVYACLIIEVISIIINFFPNKKVLGYSWTEQIKDIFPNMITCVLMAFPTLCLGLLPVNDILKLFIQCISGVGLYVLGSILTKNSNFKYLLSFIKKEDKGEY